MDGKRLGDSAFSTAMMVAFAIPGGAPAGAAIALFQFLFDLIFPPPPPPPAPPPPQLTQAELAAALAELKSDIIDAIWQSNADHVTSRILALNQGFHEVWANMKKLQMDGQRYTVMAPDDTTRDWIASTKLYFNVDAANGVLTEVRGYRNDIQNSSLNDGSLTPTQLAEHRTRTTGLYCLVSSLAISYLKAAVVWQWGLELLEAWQYQEYQKKVDHWNQQNAAYQAKNPLSALQAQYPGLNLNPGYAPPEWNKWVNGPGCPVPTLIQEVQGLLDYCVLIPDPNGGPGRPGLYAEMRAHWDEYETLVMSHPGAFELYPRPWHTDTRVINPPGRMASYPDYTGVPPQREAIIEGQKLASAAEILLEKYGLTHVTEKDINQFNDTIGAWRSAAASVNFTVHTVATGDTLLGLAYQDQTLADRLLALNQPPLTGPGALAVGTQLKIYAKEALPWAPLTVVPPTVVPPAPAT